jgi:sugar phosphate isomerase/epimerase
MNQASPPGLRFAYGTNGLGDHRLGDALALLADCGYQGVALTLDHHHLDPAAAGLAARVSTAAALLARLGLAVVVETGARFVLDPRRKHQPTLLSDEEDGQARRLGFLRLAVDVAADLGAEAVSLWAGVPPPGCPPELAWERLTEGCGVLADHAARAGIRLGFEPEPGMLVATVDDYERLLAALGGPFVFGLTLDVGHCLCGDNPPADCIRRFAHRLVHVQIEDMRRGVHEHLNFGEGDVDFPSVVAALAGIGYRGLVSVELPRHSHRAHETVPRALRFLRAVEAEVEAETAA